MSPEGPSTLHVPGQEPASSTPDLALGGAWVLVLVPIVVAVVFVAVRARRRMRMRPEEHAFRSLSRRLRLHRDQVRAVRAYAQGVARCEPIEVLMNERMLAQAIGTID